MRYVLPILVFLVTWGLALQANAQEQAPRLEPCSDLFKWVNSGAAVGSTEDFEINACLILTRAVLKNEDLLAVPGIENFEDIKFGNANITLKSQEVLLTKLATSVEKFRVDRKNSKSRRFVRGCLNADVSSGPANLLSEVFQSCSLRRSNTPNTRAASQPALFSFTRNFDGSEEDQENTFQIAAGFRATGGFNDGDSAYSIATEFQRNTTDGSEQANFNVSLGLIHDVASSIAVLSSTQVVEELRNPELNPFSLIDGYGSLRFSGELQFNRAGIFGDSDSEPCMLMPSAAFCGRQDMESIRFVGNISPYFDKLNGVDINSKGEPTLAWAVSPVFGVFYDEALNGDVVLSNGEPSDGSVLGVTAGISASLSPGIFQNRWQLSGSAQIVEALDRSAGRVDNFESTSTEIMATLSYAYREGSYVGQSTANQLVPAIAITYANGSDPLRSRTERETLTIALTLLY